MRIGIGSRNPAKVSAVSAVALPEDKVTAIDAPSGVSNQPFSDEETLQGAIQRATYCVEEAQMDIGIGLEGGVVETPRGLFLCNWGALIIKDEEPIVAGGARIPLPEPVALQLLNGKELGPVMEEYTKKIDVRKKEGAIGVFTDEYLTRSDMFEHVTKMLFGQYHYRQRISKN
ncbi:MAG: DUF84 family protein [Bacillus sp. (in: firmicutes)]